MKKFFGFLLFDDVEELDVVGPWEMISLWSKEYGGPEILTVSAEGKTITCSKGLRLGSDYSFADCPSLNYLLIPGGIGARKSVNNAPLINFIRTQAQDCDAVLSVCTGAFLLQKAGLVTGRNITTHWRYLTEMKQFPNFNIIEQRFVKDGNLWTSAGISAGMDMALAFIADTAGNETAGKIQLHAEYFPDAKSYVSLEEVPERPDYLK